MKKIPNRSAAGVFYSTCSSRNIFAALQYPINRFWRESPLHKLIESLHARFFLFFAGNGWMLHVRFLLLHFKTLLSSPIFHLWSPRPPHNISLLFLAHKRRRKNIHDLYTKKTFCKNMKAGCAIGTRRHYRAVSAIFALLFQFISFFVTLFLCENGFRSS